MTQLPEIPGEYPGQRPPPPPELSQRVGSASDDVVDGPLPCVGCGRELCGLRLGQRCPKCARPVGRSARGDLLQFTDPAYVRRLGRGVSIMFWALLGTLVAQTVALVGWGVELPGAAAAGLGLAGGVAMLLGAWEITAPEPNRPEGPWQPRLRSLARVGLTLGLGVHLAWLFACRDTMTALSDSRSAALAAMIASVAMGLVWLTGMVAILSVLGRLALRGLDPLGAQSTRQCARVFITGVGMMALGGLVIALVVAIGQARFGGAVGAGLLIIGAVLTLLGCLWLLSVLARHRGRFLQQALEAEHTWHAEP